MSNNLLPATKLRLPEEMISELAFESSYFYEVHGTSMDIYPGRIGVAIKLTVSNESKVKHWLGYYMNVLAIFRHWL